MSQVDMRQEIRRPCCGETPIHPTRVDSPIQKDLPTWMGPDCILQHAKHSIQNEFPSLQRVRMSENGHRMDI